ncbi:MAG: hypothetical protein ACLUVC_02370 [Longibaculum sp.]
MKFKVGDKVRAISNDYSITSKNEYWEGIVTKVYNKYYFSAKTTSVRNKGIEYSGLDVRDFELINKSTQEIRVTVKGSETIAVMKEDGNVIKRSTAKCSPQDKFNFETGAKLAIERLFENNKRMILKYLISGECRGVVGRKTLLKDINDTPLFVGDVVEIFDEKKSLGMQPVCHKGCYGDYISGIALASSTINNHGNIVDGFRILKRKDYKELRCGDQIYDTLYCEE